MSEATYDVVAIGNAIVDVLAQADDDFLRRHGCTKGAMTLVDEFRAETLLKGVADRKESSGGSVANSMAGLASFGAQGLFIGKVKDDRLGTSFVSDLKKTGCDFRTPMAKSGPRSVANSES